MPRRPSYGTSPSNVDVVGRFLLTAKLYHPPPPRIKSQRGAPRKKGLLIGLPKIFTTPSPAWHPHPQEAEAFIQAAARTLWCIAANEQHADVALQRFRP